MNKIQQLLTEHIDIWTAADTAKKSGRGRGVNNGTSVYGIKKLRELILELAVRGKLVPQDPNDAPASELLKCIETEKIKLFEKEKIKKNKLSLVQIHEKEIPFSLPNQWIWVRLSQICEANTGYAFKSGEYTTKGTFVLRVTNINPDGSINLTDTKYINSDIANSTYQNFLLSAGDILLVMVGGSLGKIGIVDESCLPAVLNQNMWKINKVGCIVKDYFLLGLQYINSSQLEVTSSTHGHLAQGEYLSKLFPLPPLIEQHRVVTKVKELTMLCDQLEAQCFSAVKAHEKLVSHLLSTLTQSQNAEEFSENWQRIAAHFDILFTTEESIDTLKQTLLQLAVMGKLVPQDPNDEPASELLKRIQAEKAKLVAEGKIRKNQLAPPLINDEEPCMLPKGWKWCRLQDITKLITDGKHGNCNDLSKSGYYFLSAKDIQNGKLLYENARQIVPVEFQEVHARTALEPGDICMVNTGATIGKFAIAPDHAFTSRTTFQKSVAVIKIIRPYINQNYIINFLTAETNNLLKKSGGSAINNLLLSDLKNKLVPLPPLREQAAIATKVDELMILCDQLKNRFIEVIQLEQKLADVIVEQAAV